MLAADVIFEWRIHPLRDHPRRAVLFVLTLIATLAAVWWSFRSVGWVLIAALFVGGSLHRFWLATDYRISEQELEYRRLFVRMTRPWSDFRRVDFDERGAFLSPFAAPHRLDAYRGIYLPYSADWQPLKLFLEQRIAQS